MHVHCYHYPVTNSASKFLPRDLSTVFLDRDGVLNEKMPEGTYVTSWDDFHILPGVPEAIARLNRAGLRVIVVSNQRGIALGLYSAADVEAIHLAFQRLLNSQGAHIDAFFIHLRRLPVFLTLPNIKQFAEHAGINPQLTRQRSRRFPLRSRSRIAQRNQRMTKERPKSRQRPQQQLPLCLRVS